VLEDRIGFRQQIVEANKATIAKQAAGTTNEVEGLVASTRRP
jgi:hypothetical protein